MVQFKRGLTLFERQKLRSEILERELEQARSRAAVARLTVACRNAMIRASGSPQAGALHQSCNGEERGNSGCLCPCHDVVTGSVEIGQMELPLQFEQ